MVVSFCTFACLLSYLVLSFCIFYAKHGSVILYIYFFSIFYTVILYNWLATCYCHFVQPFGFSLILFCYFVCFWCHISASFSVILEHILHIRNVDSVIIVDTVSLNEIKWLIVELDSVILHHHKLCCPFVSNMILSSAQNIRLSNAHAATGLLFVVVFTNDNISSRTKFNRFKWSKQCCETSTIVIASIPKTDS